MKLIKPGKKTKRLKATVANYRLKIKGLKTKMVGAMRNYKEAVDKERIEAANRLKRL